MISLTTLPSCPNDDYPNNWYAWKKGSVPPRYRAVVTHRILRPLSSLDMVENPPISDIMIESRNHAAKIPPDTGASQDTTMKRSKKMFPINSNCYTTRSSFPEYYQRAVFAVSSGFSRNADRRDGWRPSPAAYDPGTFLYQVRLVEGPRLYPCFPQAADNVRWHDRPRRRTYR